MDAIHQRVESTVIIRVALRLRCWVRRSVWLLSRHKPALPLQNGCAPITAKTYVAPDLAANSGEIRHIRLRRLYRLCRPQRALCGAYRVAGIPARLNWQLTV